MLRLTLDSSGHRKIKTTGKCEKKILEFKKTFGRPYILVGGAPKYSSVHCGISALVLDTPYPEDVTYSELEVREVLLGF